MPDTKAEGIFEKLKKFFNPGSIWQKVLVSPHDLLKSFGTLTKAQNSSNSFRTPFTTIKMIFNNTETILH